MKLVLASQGFTTPAVTQRVAELVGKPAADINVAVINEAYTGLGAGVDDRWLVDELRLLAGAVGGTIAFVNLRAYDAAEVEKRLDFADLVYIVGGKQAVLPALFAETGFDDVLRRAAESKIIMGTSAGANILGKQITDEAYWTDQYGTAEPFASLSSLNLVDFNVLPHFERADHPKRTHERLDPLLKNHPFMLYGLTDEQAVIVDGDDVSFVGGEPVVFGVVGVDGIEPSTNRL
jgi:dipeptidase E